MWGVGAAEGQRPGLELAGRTGSTPGQRAQARWGRWPETQCGFSGVLRNLGFGRRKREFLRDFEDRDGTV